MQGSYRHKHELWILMEYCGGGSLSDVLSATNRPLPEAAIAYVCSEALKVGGVRRDGGTGRQPLPHSAHCLCTPPS